MNKFNMIFKRYSSVLINTLSFKTEAVKKYTEWVFFNYVDKLYILSSPA